MWVKPHNINNVGLCWYGGGTNWAIFEAGVQEGKFRFKIYDGSDYMLFSSSINIDEWYFLAFSYGSEGMKLYVDGELVDSNSYTGDGSSGGENKFFGSQAGWTTFFNGLIDEVNVWEGQLSSDELKNIFENVHEVTPSTPAIYRAPSSLSRTVTEGSNASSQSFSVGNSGDGTLSYSISDNVAWLSCTPPSGTSTGETDTIAINYSTSSLSVGTHNATITISASGASNSP